MTDCSDALKELYEYIDGELTDEKRAHIQQHLTDCSPCLEAFDFHAELGQVVAHKCREVVPDQLRDRIADALSAERSTEAPG